MSEPTTTAVGRASPMALGVRPIDAPAPVPGYTRHTRGGIEAERDRRLRSHAARRHRHVRRLRTPHPRIDAARIAQALFAAQTGGDENRWVDDGGRFDPVAAGQLRIANRKMKRCNS